VEFLQPTYFIALGLVSGLLAYLIARRRHAPDATAWAAFALLTGPVGIVCALLVAKPARPTG
jgi:hypothetical protein